MPGGGTVGRHLVPAHARLPGGRAKGLLPPVSNRPFRVALVTTFFGAHRFGGDAAYVERLAAALLRRGHAVSVFYSPAAFGLLSGGRAALDYTPTPGLVLAPLRVATPRLDLLWMHQTGRLGRQGRELVRQLADGRFDVIHYHNISLMGGAALLRASPPEGVRVMTAHEHWLTCPTSVLWRLGREACTRATCLRCTLHAGRPPQLWRRGGTLAAAVAQLDALIFPSHHARASHADRGIRHPRTPVLPYFLPDDWIADQPPPPTPTDAPFRFIGRLVAEKGLQTLLPLFRARPQCRLEVIGDGPFRPELERLASGAANIRFRGAVPAAGVRTVLPGTRALLVPSRFPETFGYVLAEAWSQGVPTLASDQGALPEVTAGGGGWICRSPAEFAHWIDHLHVHPAEARTAGLAGWTRTRRDFNEAAHLRAWEEIVREGESPPSLPPPPLPATSPVPPIRFS